MYLTDDKDFKIRFSAARGQYYRCFSSTKITAGHQMNKIMLVDILMTQHLP